MDVSIGNAHRFRTADEIVNDVTAHRNEGKRSVYDAATLTTIAATSRTAHAITVIKVPKPAQAEQKPFLVKDSPSPPKQNNNGTASSGTE
jgi:hypothetical protein